MDSSYSTVSGFGYAFVIICKRHLNRQLDPLNFCFFAIRDGEGNPSESQLPPDKRSSWTYEAFLVRNDFDYPFLLPSIKWLREKHVWVNKCDARHCNTMSAVAIRTSVMLEGFCFSCLLADARTFPVCSLTGLNLDIHFSSFTSLIFNTPPVKSMQNGPKAAFWLLITSKNHNTPKNSSLIFYFRTIIFMWKNKWNPRTNPLIVYGLLQSEDG